MTEYCLEFLRRIGYVNTQTLIYRHLDRPHPHAHVVLNRVDNDSKCLNPIAIPGCKNPFKEVALQMNKDFGFSDGKDKSFLPIDKPINFSKPVGYYIKLDMKNDIAYAMSKIGSIDKLQEQLLIDATHISMRFHYADDGITRNGISFSKVYTDERGKRRAFNLSGSQIDPIMAYGGILWAIQYQAKLETDLQRAKSLIEQKPECSILDPVSMVIDKDVKALQRILDKKAAKDKDIHECWESNKADGLSRIAFCLRYGKRFTSLIESLEKSLSVYKRHGTIEELGLDDHSADKHLDNQIKQTPKNDSSLDNGISFPF